MDKIGADSLDNLIRQALESYFSECRERIPWFVDTYYSYPGAWQTNRKALGWDLLKAPLNLFWAPFFVVIRLMAMLASRFGAYCIATWLYRAPSGFETQVQHYITSAIRDQLFVANQLDEHLLKAIQADSKLADNSALRQRYETLLREVLEEYSVTRTAAADITNVVASALAGALLWHKLCLGGFALGLMIAAEIHRYKSIESFVFGPTLGSWYYHWFPPQPDATAQLLGIVMALIILAVLAVISGFISDPLQSALGLHRYRLRKLVDSTEKAVLENSANRFKPKDQYLARVTDTIDAIRSSFI